MTSNNLNIRSAEDYRYMMDGAAPGRNRALTYKKTYKRRNKIMAPLSGFILFTLLTICLTLLLVKFDAQASGLILNYDDRYTFSSEYKVLSVKNKKVTSYRVSNGKKTGKKDAHILSKVKGNKYRASGVGTAVVTLKNKETGKKTKITVVVNPARLTLMVLAGQSNMTGVTPSKSSSERKRSVICKEGTVYSTFILNRKYITGCSGMTTVTGNYTARKVVAGSLTGSRSISGKKLAYPLYALTKRGKGKAGMDGALAYEWNKLTGDKVWIVNVSQPGSHIKQWSYNRKCIRAARATAKYVLKTYNAEIRAGHYTKGNKLCFWMQGEGNRFTSLSTYSRDFKNMYKTMKKAWKFQKMGIISERVGRKNNLETLYKDLALSSSRYYKYRLGASNTSFAKDIYIVSDANAQWVSNKGVKSYFETAYPKGKYTYPTRKKITLPTTLAQVHPGLHFKQIGHNENGITAARGMYNVIYENYPDQVSVSFLKYSGRTVSKLTVSTQQSVYLVCRCSSSFATKELTFKTSNNLASYKNQILKTGKKAGTVVISAYYNGELVGKIKIKIKNSSSASGTAVENASEIESSI